MKNLYSIKVRLIFTIVAVSIGTILCVGGFFIYNMIRNSENQIADYRQTLVENVDRELKRQTEIAMSLIKDVYSKQQSGMITEAQAKVQAASLIRQLRYDDGRGYFWIDTYDGVNVVLMGRDIEGQSRIDSVDPNGKYYIKEIIENGRKADGGYTDLMFAKPNETIPLPKRNYSIAFDPYKWVLGTGGWIDYIDARVAQKEAAEKQILQDSIIRIVIYMAVLQIILIGIAIYVGKILADPIEFVTEKMNILATGDFSSTVEGKILERKDEIGIMGRSLQSLHNNVKTLLKKIAESAEYLAASAQELTSSAEQSATASNQVADSMVNVAHLCNDQFSAVDGAGKNTSDLSSHMQNFMSAIEESGQKIKLASEAAGRGNKEVSAAVSKMEDMERSVSKSAEVIGGLGKRSEKIGAIVDTIGSIAGQTNLLALNAAIEAARAGEHGKGFAVVAEEVRKLAEQSQMAASEIAELISSIQNETQNAVTVMQTGVDQVKEGSSVVDNAGNTFGDIVGMVEQIAERSESMEQIVGSLAKGTEDIAATVEKIDSMSRSVSAEAETVSAATEEQTASMNEIADASRTLAQMAQELQGAVSSFKI
ncbi:methyl-accepting chemotaxis protein [Pectinatus haikarae]|uniref:Methyl-accepting chemotaxis protein n=1 Tax=Pectinatus haikarae TaxID=349096 RepID=A0ABT9Y687_9FIRM|nr:methyl-accepting chemotaxis protein [Pectinatus haikarae]MDQ0203344.1 methyl-accepting chemotaxis protein [Pectinatus haikarae]